MSTAIGDLVATLGLQTGPFQSGITAASSMVYRFTGGPLGDLANGISGLVTGPFSRMKAVAEETFGQLVNLVNPVNWLAKGFNLLMYPLQFCMRELEGAADPSRAIEAFQRIENASVRLQTVLKANPGLGFNFDQLKAMAGGKVAGMEAMVPMVMSGKIGGDNFRAAFQAAKDLSLAMGWELPAAAQKVTRALLDPEKGMRALRQAGIQLTADQKTAVSALLSVGDAAGAQAIVLNRIQAATGDMARTMGGTLTAHFRGFKQSVEELSAMFGEALKPVMVQVLDMFKEVANWASSNKETIVDWGNKAAGAFAQVTKPVQDFFTLLKTDAGAAWLDVQLGWSKTLDAIGTGLTWIGTNFPTIWKNLKEEVKSILDWLGEYFKSVLANLGKDLPAQASVGFFEWAGLLSEQEKGALAEQRRIAAANLRKGPAGALPKADELTPFAVSPSDRTKELAEQFAKTAAAAAIDPAVKAAEEERKKTAAAADRDKMAGAAGDAQAKGDAIAKGRANEIAWLEGRNKDLRAQEHTKDKPELPKAMEAGSDEAWSRIMAAIYGTDKEDEQKVHTDLLKEIAENTKLINDLKHGGGDAADDAADLEDLG
jgi:hypothetical protein